jgi:hypothetical protein
MNVLDLPYSPVHVLGSDMIISAFIQYGQSQQHSAFILGHRAGRAPERAVQQA